MERNGRILNAFEKEILERVERIERHLGLDPVPARLRESRPTVIYGESEEQEFYGDLGDAIKEMRERRRDDAAAG